MWLHKKAGQRPQPVIDSLLPASIKSELKSKGYVSEPAQRGTAGNKEDRNGFFLRGQAGGVTNAVHTASTAVVHLSAPVTVTAVVAAVVLAILGGLIAGGFGGWRAARLRPAAALSKVA